MYTMGDEEKRVIPWEMKKREGKKVSLTVYYLEQINKSNIKISTCHISLIK